MGIALFSLTLGVFVTSTVAWFDISNNLVVNTMSLSLGDPDSVQVAFSKDGQYYSKVTQDILEANTTYKKSDPLQAVTSAFQSEWLNDGTKFDDTVPLFKRNPNSTMDAFGGYIQLDLYVKTAFDGYLYLDDSTYVRANQSANEKTARQKELSQDELDSAAKSMRYSFYTEEYGLTIFEPGALTPSETAFGGRIDYYPMEGYYDYATESNGESYERFFGEYNSADNPTFIYGDAAAEDSPVNGIPSCFTASTKAGVRPLDLSRSISEGGLKIATEKSYVLSDLVPPKSGLGHPLLYCYADEPKRIVISIYCEGWDLDSIESVGYASFDMSVVLTATIDQPKMD